MLKLVNRLFARLNPPRQTIKFEQETSINGFTFDADRFYTFKVVKLGNVRWLVYRGERLMTLDSFANLYVDQRQAQWVDDASQYAA